MSRTVSAWLLFGLLLLAVAGLAAGAGAQGEPSDPAVWESTSLAPPSGPSYVEGLIATRPTIVSGPLEFEAYGRACTAPNEFDSKIGFEITVTVASDGRFSFEGPTDGPKWFPLDVASVSGRLIGATLSGVVRMRGSVVKDSGATCTFDTGNTAFTVKCTYNCIPPAPPKPPPPKPGDGSRAGDGLIVPFRSIGGAKLGMTLGQLKAVLGRPTIQKCGLAYWSNHGLRIWLKSCKGGAYLLEHQKSGGHLRYPKRTSTGGGLGTRDARMKAAFSPARFRCRSSDVESRNGRGCQARQMIRGKAFITSWASTNQIVVYVNIYRCKNTNPGVTGQPHPRAEIWEPCGSDFFTAQLRYPPRG